MVPNFVSYCRAEPSNHQSPPQSHRRMWAGLKVQCKYNGERPWFSKLPTMASNFSLSGESPKVSFQVKPRPPPRSGSARAPPPEVLEAPTPASPGLCQTCKISGPYLSVYDWPSHSREPFYIRQPRPPTSIPLVRKPRAALPTNSEKPINTPGGPRSMPWDGCEHGARSGRK